MEVFSLLQPGAQSERQVFDAAQFIRALESLTDGFGLLDRDCRLTYLSPQAAQLLKCSAAEVVGEILWQAFPYLVETNFQRVALQSLVTQAAANFREFSARLNSWLEFHLEPSLSGLLVTLRDVTAQKQAAETERRLVTILETTTDFVSIADVKGRVPYLNRAGRRLIGVGEGEDISQINLVLHPKWASDYLLAVGLPAAMREGVWAGETALLTRGGREVPVSQVIIVHKNEAGEVEFVSTIARDISERKRAEERLREQAELLNHAQDAIIVRGLDHRIIFWNQGAEKIYGWAAQDAVGRDIRELIYDEMGLGSFEAAFQDLLARGEWGGELRHVTRAGQEVMAQCHWSLVRDEVGRPKSVLVINTDVTAQRALEEQLLRTQRLESIGTLASGMAHDLNNVLSPVLLAVRILGMKLHDEESQRLLGILKNSAERGASLIRQVLTYARGADGERIVLNLGHLVKEITRILNDTFPKSIRLRVTVPPDLWSVTGDPTQIYQVLMNLAVNARDAMPQGGRLEVSAENARLDEAYARRHLGVRPGAYVMLSVTDTGEGIAPHVREKIFDPFFTTKPHGQGTGLGLSTVAGIVKGHGGFINVYSEVGKGTCFKILLPARLEEAQQIEPDSEVVPVGNGETVLIVDDEPEVLSVTEEVLTAYGYRVIVAEGGAEAVALSRRHYARPGVALVDLMMPGMSGQETMRALRELNPRVKLIGTSGLAESERVREARLAGAQAFLPKPFVADTLLQTIADVLMSN